MSQTKMAAFQDGHQQFQVIESLSDPIILIIIFYIENIN